MNRNLFTKVSQYVGALAGVEEIRQSVKTASALLKDLHHEWILRSDAKYADPRRLNRHEHQVFSQFGEDGIIAELFRRIGEKTRFFVEFGVGDGLENNTAALLLRGWSGVWLEGDPRHSQAITANMSRLLASGRLRFRETFVTRENVQSLFDETGVPAEPDLLSVDIDGNDLWIWSAIDRFRPRVVVIEYNGALGPAVDWTIKYDAKHEFDGSSYFGASLKALENIGAEKGYALVACNTAGVNAFFVRRDLLRDELFASPYTALHHFEPPRYHLHRRAGKPRSYRMFDVDPR